MNLRKNKKGFTLVEVIVVLVILAILAAILVPSMIGWIEKAEKKTAVVEARTFLLAAQTIASENYTDYKSTADAAPMEDSHVTAAVTLSGIAVTPTEDSVIVTGGRVTAFIITSTGGFVITYNGTDYTVA